MQASLAAGDVGSVSHPCGRFRSLADPEAGCDVPSHYYSFSFAPNPDWSKYFSKASEIAGYTEAVAEHYGVVPHIQFHTKVLGCSFDDATHKWVLRHVTVDPTTPSSGENMLVVDALITCCGQVRAQFSVDDCSSQTPVRRQAMDWPPWYRPGAGARGMCHGWCEGCRTNAVADQRRRRPGLAHTDHRLSHSPFCLSSCAPPLVTAAVGACDPADPRT